MTKYHLEALCFLAHRGQNVPVPGVSPNPLWKELTDMGYVMRDEQGRDVLSPRGEQFIIELRNFATYGPVRLTAGAIRILMTLISNSAPKDISFYGAAQLAGLQFLTVAENDVVSLTTLGTVVSNTILNFVKDK